MVYTYSVCMSIFALQSFTKRSHWLRDLKRTKLKLANLIQSPWSGSIFEQSLVSGVFFCIILCNSAMLFTSHNMCLLSAQRHAHRNTYCKCNTQWRLSHHCHHSSWTGLTRARTRSVMQGHSWPCSVWHKCYPSGGQVVPVLSANEDSLALHPVWPWNDHFIPWQSSFQLPKLGRLSFFLLLYAFWTWQMTCFTQHTFVIVKN